MQKTENKVSSTPQKLTSHSTLDGLRDPEMKENFMMQEEEEEKSAKDLYAFDPNGDYSDSDEGDIDCLKMKQTDLIVSKFQTCCDLKYFQHEPESYQRGWLYKHGKGSLIDFEKDQLVLLRNCFDQLCDDGIESIGVEELEEPLIAMGLVANRSEVEKLVAEVDQDQNGEIEFSEFLEIIKGGRKKDKDVEGG